MARLVVSGLLVFASLVAVGLSLAGVAPRAWQVAVAAWAVWGAVHGVFDLILEPLMEFLSRSVTDAGLRRSGGGFSEVETLEAQGHIQAAADAYRDRATRKLDRVNATLRRAALLAGPLAEPNQAVAELEALQQSSPRLSPADAIVVGLALADLHEHRLDAPGAAMAELRRLIDAYPGSHHARHLRATLAALREQHFGAPPAPEPGA
jgi:hypothetical protein